MAFKTAREQAAIKALFRQAKYKHLFEAIDVTQYADCPENFYRDAECDTIRIGDQDYRYWKDSISGLL